MVWSQARVPSLVGPLLSCTSTRPTRSGLPSRTARQGEGEGAGVNGQGGRQGLVDRGRRAAGACRRRAVAALAALDALGVGEWVAIPWVTGCFAVRIVEECTMCKGAASCRPHPSVLHAPEAGGFHVVCAYVHARGPTNSPTMVWPILANFSGVSAGDRFSTLMDATVMLWPGVDSRPSGPDGCSGDDATVTACGVCGAATVCAVRLRHAGGCLKEGRAVRLQGGCSGSYHVVCDG